MKQRAEFRFPAEWEPHAATWLTWPHNGETWPRNLKSAQAEFETFARTLAEVEDVRILATGELATELKQRFQQQPRIQIVNVPTNDSWIRDYGPTFVKSHVDGQVAGIDWIYNGWGEKYPPFDEDQRAARLILEASQIPRIESSLILEGGSIDSNGRSLVLTTRLCQERRNPDWTDEQISNELSLRLGIDQIVMLDCVEIDGDDTDGHVDQVVRFVAENRVVVPLRQWDAVRPALEPLGLEMIPLPDPEETRRFGNVLPASYANFYLASELVVVPAFGAPEDAAAIAVLSALFPDRRVIGLPSANLTVGLGSFHCLSQQQPA